MDLVDMRTIFILTVIVYSVCTLLLLFSWRKNNDHYAGINFWVADFFLLTLAQLFIALRGFIPDWISIVVANSMAISGSILGYIGLAHFLNKRIKHRYNIGLIISFISIFSYFTFVNPDLEMRHLIGSFFWLTTNLRCLYLIICKAERSTISFTKPLIYAYGLIALVNTSRVVKFFVAQDLGDVYFKSGTFEKLVVIMMLVMFIILTYSIVLTLTNRLFEDINKQEKKYNNIFTASPNAIMITRLRDGKILEVNDGFLHMFKYQDEDVVGKTTEGIRVWLKKEDRKKFIYEMKDSGRVRNLEMNLRKKTGEIITGLLSADIIEVDQEDVIISVTNDISIRKAMEEKIVDMSNRDSLTNTYNRRYLFARLEIMLKEYIVSEKGFSISMIDIDFFKKVNDEYGHQGGDVVLVELTRFINSSIRDCDLLARYGGEEFIIVSSGTDRVQTEIMINRILESIRNTTVKYENREIAYTFSCGIADTFEFSKEGLDIEMIINKADARLYEAKDNGRNQININS